MHDWMRRALRARPELVAELWQRGLFSPGEKKELLRRDAICRIVPERRPPLGSVVLATLLAQADAQLAARAVLSGLLDLNELSWLDRLLRFQKPNGKRDELCRIVERALERRKGHA
jgi:hypothetical protein